MTRRILYVALDVALWGPYLVWAALFGQADRVLNAVPLTAAGVVDDLALAVRGLAGRSDTMAEPT